MDSFIEDLISFVGRRVDSAKNLLSMQLVVPEAVYAGLNDEEKASAKEALEREKVYLQGFADGIRLVTMLTQKG